MPALGADLALGSDSGLGMRLGRSHRLRKRTTPSNARLGVPATATRRGDVIEGEEVKKRRAPRA